MEKTQLKVGIAFAVLSLTACGGGSDSVPVDNSSDNSTTRATATIGAAGGSLMSLDGSADSDYTS